MDDFGVLVEGYGIKSQGKSAPMAASKTAAKKPNNYTSVNLDPTFGTKPFSNSTHSSNLGSGSFFNDQNDDIFGLNSVNKPNNYASSDVFDDVFQIPATNSGSSSGGGVGGFGFDVESMLKGSLNLNSSSNSKASDVSDDLIWGFSGNGSSKASNVVLETDDLLSSDPVDDFFGKLGNSGPARSGSVKTGSDDLIPGFGRSNAANDRAQAASTEKSSGSSSLGELEDFLTVGTKKTVKGHANGTSVKKVEKKSVSKKPEAANFIDIEGSLHGESAHSYTAKKASDLMFQEEAQDLDSFFRVTGETKKTVKGYANGTSVKKVEKKSVSKKPEEANFIDIEGSLHDESAHNYKAEKASDLMFQEEAQDLDSFFRAHTRKSAPVTEDTSMNTKTNEVPDLFSETTFGKEKIVPQGGIPDDLTSIFGGAPPSRVFEECDGESDERRKLRYERHLKSTARMKQALEDLNQREYNAQQEKEERHRIAEAMEVEMKRWATGKEGNLRALLSSLQQVLAPELGWRPVTLTDLITSSQVKIAYKKAALCVHPDKVQQKGASLQQKYVAEKAFDLLKEAWNKFNTEELR
ncbi:auxilin-related protein 1-like [Chenopodium quinoa]|uniref:J domain-containing protein n=1 Tax=Chenopodium quinoa TaxID=63459 RepID=A0A803L784_CHEQI|nr:auxilin-related protein 1-like [Chenopodium quinoa]